MPIPSDPYTFANGTTADALEVNARFNPLYTALNGAVDSTNMSLSSAFAWTAAHSFTTTTTTGNAVAITASSLTSGSALAIVSNSSDTTARSIVSIIQDHASASAAIALTVRNDTSALPAIQITGGHFEIQSAGRLYLNGTTRTSYISETATNIVDCVVGGTNLLQLDGAGTKQINMLNVTLVTIPAACKLYLDGGSDTYINNTSSDVIDMVVGGATAFTAIGSSTQFVFGASFDVSVYATKRIYFDGGSDTYWHEQSSNVLQAVVGGTARLSISDGDTSVAFSGATNVKISAASLLYFDGGGNTFAAESSADILDFTVGGSVRLQLDGNGTTQANFANVTLVTIPAACGFYMDGGGDTYWIEGAPNEPQLYAGGVVTIDCQGGVFGFGSQGSITASTTQTQGQQPLTRSVNIITVVANANDVVTLPSVYAGAVCMVINRGANTLQVFPASGDSINEGALDASVTLTTLTETMFVGLNTGQWVNGLN